MEKSYSVEEIKRALALWEAVSCWMNPPQPSPVVQSYEAMERLQELVKRGWRMNFFLFTGEGNFAIDMMDEDENNVIAEGATLPDAILNIKAEKMSQPDKMAEVRHRH